MPHIYRFVLNIANISVTYLAIPFKLDIALPSTVKRWRKLPYFTKKVNYINRSTSTTQIYIIDMSQIELLALFCPAGV